MFAVVKDPTKTNAFAMGVTIGRTDNNDITFHDNSVSRFHAYLQHDGRGGGWKLFDAESRNGSFVEGTRLSKGVGMAVADGSRIKLGDVTVRLLSARSLAEFIKNAPG